MRLSVEGLLGYLGLPGTSCQPPTQSSQWDSILSGKGGARETTAPELFNHLQPFSCDCVMLLPAGSYHSNQATGTLFRSEDDYRIHAGGAAGRQIAGGQCHRDQQDRYRDKGDRIARAHTEEQA